uniref:Uncharacterized protein n=1 Tax=Plectus sambesii TaxID=2011161 RepID=A0A914UPX5_9BILA
MRRAKKCTLQANARTFGAFEEEDKECLNMSLMSAHAGLLDHAAGEKKATEKLDQIHEQKMKREAALFSRRALHVDQSCRVLFPLLFLVINIIYWAKYLTK